MVQVDVDLEVGLRHVVVLGSHRLVASLVGDNFLLNLVTDGADLVLAVNSAQFAELGRTAHVHGLLLLLRLECLVRLRLIRRLRYEFVRVEEVSRAELVQGYVCSAGALSELIKALDRDGRWQVAAWLGHLDGRSLAEKELRL